MVNHIFELPLRERERERERVLSTPLPKVSVQGRGGPTAVHADAVELEDVRVVDGAKDVEFPQELFEQLGAMQHQKWACGEELRTTPKRSPWNSGTPCHRRGCRHECSKRPFGTS